jgi:hypothetical protein
MNSLFLPNFVQKSDIDKDKDKEKENDSGSISLSLSPTTSEDYEVVDLPDPVVTMSSGLAR